jgi:sulfur-oxidizing protein SoxA
MPPVLAPGRAKKSAADGIAEYRKMLEDGNPAELFEAKGEDLWKKKRGPEERLAGAVRPGQGPGRRQGCLRRDAALLCRHRPHAGPRVAPGDLHGDAAGHRPRRDRQDAFGKGETANIDRAGHLDRRHVARHALQPAAGPCRRTQAPTRSASAAFFFRGGPMDFSCATCHGEDGKRIRLQDLPNLTKNPGDGIGFAAWPAYRVSNGQMWSMQLRLNDCYPPAALSRTRASAPT